MEKSDHFKYGFHFHNVYKQLDRIIVQGTYSLELRPKLVFVEGKSKSDRGWTASQRDISGKGRKRRESILQNPVV